MITVETLNADRFSELQGIADGITPAPQNSVAIVARAGQEYVGRVFLIGLVHLEGTWVAPAHRRGRVGWQLIQRAREECKKAGLTHIMAYAADTDVEGYMERLGFTKLPVTVWQQEL